MKSTAHAEWRGGLKDGSGSITTGSELLRSVPYSFRTRFEGETVGTTPEELIGAAHAGCFAMALSAELGKAGITPEDINASAVVTLGKDETGFAIDSIALNVTVNAKGAERQKVEAAAAAAKEGCPVSKVLRTRVDLDLMVNT